MSRIPTRSLSLAVFAIAILVKPVLTQERVENRSAGIALDRPASWQMATTADIQANRERVRLSDSDFQHAMVTRSALPIIAMMKTRNHLRASPPQCRSRCARH